VFGGVVVYALYELNRRGIVSGTAMLIGVGVVTGLVVLNSAAPSIRAYMTATRVRNLLIFAGACAGLYGLYLAAGIIAQRYETTVPRIIGLGALVALAIGLLILASRNFPAIRRRAGVISGRIGTNLNRADVAITWIFTAIFLGAAFFCVWLNSYVLFIPVLWLLFLSFRWRRFIARGRGAQFGKIIMPLRTLGVVGVWVIIVAGEFMKIGER
jgi:hypothetical protein